MGEVYRAHDDKLDRDVAIRFCRGLSSPMPERVARFEREARILAALNHPRIGAIYGLEYLDGMPALILELVEGPTLAERLGDGPLPWRRRWQSRSPSRRRSKRHTSAASSTGISSPPTSS